MLMCYAVCRPDWHVAICCVRQSDSQPVRRPAVSTLEVYNLPFLMRNTSHVYSRMRNEYPGESAGREEQLRYLCQHFEGLGSSVEVLDSLKLLPMKPGQHVRLIGGMQSYCFSVCSLALLYLNKTVPQQVLPLANPGV